MPWTAADVAFDRIEHDRVRDREELLVLLAGTSFVEFAADTFAANLAVYCRDDPDFAAWLTTRWEAEERQHGEVLRAYVERVWPRFDWQAAYDAFFAEYSCSCGAETYAPTAGLEMLARCAVETGTSTCYHALRDFAGEPVLRDIAESIRRDEVRHYKHFLLAFERDDRRARYSRPRVAAALWRRLVAARNADTELAFRVAYRHLHPGEPPGAPRYVRLRADLARTMRAHFPLQQAVRMMLRPLRLPRLLALLAEPPLAAALRAVLFR